eukprot:5971259-Prymnesium_polylepis.1
MCPPHRTPGVQQGPRRARAAAGLYREARPDGGGAPRARERAARHTRRAAAAAGDAAVCTVCGLGAGARGSDA